jgi:hypothetical protein
MKTKLTIAVLLAAATLGTSAYARGGDHDDRGWDGRRDHGRDHWQHQRHDDWRYDHRRDDWRHDHHRPPYAYGYAPPPRRYEEPVVLLPVPPLPPPPHEVLRDLLRGHR